MGNSSADIGKRIKRLRDERQLTQEALAKDLKVSREALAKWEIGERDLKTEFTIRFADYFGVTCDEILRDIKAENVDIHKKTGLNDAAIATLEEFTKGEPLIVYGTDTGFSKCPLKQTINAILENEENCRIVELISEFIEYYDLPKDHGSYSYVDGYGNTKTEQIKDIKGLLENSVLREIEKAVISLRKQIYETNNARLRFMQEHSKSVPKEEH